MTGSGHRVESSRETSAARGPSSIRPLHPAGRRQEDGQPRSARRRKPVTAGLRRPDRYGASALSEQGVQVPRSIEGERLERDVPRQCERSGVPPIPRIPRNGFIAVIIIVGPLSVSYSR
ncbi:hypothetical protein DEJ23_01275 [Curtobacterium sp. MCSS17_008]|nr:hypothetical protein DEJ23_01275 [Curtobacterium sp. MCSS17_008]